MTLQGQQHLTTKILVDGKVKRVGVKPTELGTAVWDKKQKTRTRENRAEKDTSLERTDNGRKQ